MNLCATDMELI